MTVTEELQKLANLTSDCPKKLVGEQIRRIGKEGGELAYQITQILIKEKMERGYTKKYSLTELQKKLPWKKSRLIEKLQRVVEIGILKHEKRKYLLNKENELVKRIWNYYNEPSYQEKEKIEEIRKLIQRKKELERELDKEERKDTRKYREMTKKEEKEYKEEIIREIMADVNARPKEFIMKNILEALGYKKQKRK